MTSLIKFIPRYFILFVVDNKVFKIYSNIELQFYNSIYHLTVYVLLSSVSGRITLFSFLFLGRSCVDDYLFLFGNVLISPLYLILPLLNRIVLANSFYLSIF